MRIADFNFPSAHASFEEEELNVKVIKNGTEVLMTMNLTVDRNTVRALLNAPHAMTAIGKCLTVDAAKALAAYDNRVLEQQRAASNVMMKKREGAKKNGGQAAAPKLEDLKEVDLTPHVREVPPPDRKEDPEPEPEA